MAHQRKGPAGEILPADAIRMEATASGDRELGSRIGGDRADTADGVSRGAGCQVLGVAAAALRKPQALEEVLYAERTQIPSGAALPARAKRARNRRSVA